MYSLFAMRRLVVCSGVVTLLALIASLAPLARSDDSAARHDFDFLVGSWKVHHRYLKQPLQGSSEWIEFDGRSKLQPILGGAGNIDQYWVVKDGKESEGVAIRLFNPQNSEWLIYWADQVLPGVVQPPAKGKFHGDVGEFVGDDKVGGKKVLCRLRWTRSESPRWEQAFSADGGKTWETNWVMTFTRDNPAAAVAKLDGSHDFDFLVGEWRVHHRVKREDRSWLEFDGTATNRQLMNGGVNVEDHTFNKTTGISRGVAIRAYDLKTSQWAIWWIDGTNPLGTLDPPEKGSFEKGVGTFYSDGTLNGKPKRTRFIWSQITPSFARWEQAFSFDNGKSWETNRIMEFQRIS